MSTSPGQGWTRPALLGLLLLRTASHGQTAPLSPLPTDQSGGGSHTIVASAGMHGVITPSGTVTVENGGNTNFTIVADPGHRIWSVKVDGANVAAFGQGDTNYVCAFVDVTNDHTIAAEFETNAVARHWADGYRTQGTNTIFCDFTYPTNRTLLSLKLQWNSSLPSGWTFGTASGDGSPQVTNDSEIVFAGALTNNPIVFSYTVIVPAGETGKKDMDAGVEYQLEGMINPSVIPALPDPLALKCTPTVSVWPAASGITYGQTLAAATLSGGTGSVAGAFAFTSPTTAPTAGVYSASVTFTPADTANYNTVAGSVNVAVARATLTLTGLTASDKTYDGTTSATILSFGTLTGVVGDDDVMLNTSGSVANFDTAQPGATKTVTVSGLTLTGADSANYTIGDPTTTADIVLPAVTALHGSDGYRSPSDSMVVTNVFGYPADQVLATLSWTPLLPPGWALSSANGDGNPVVVGSAIQFAGLLTNRPIAFNYVATVPGGQGISNVLSGAVRFRFVGMIDESLTAAMPDPLLVYRYHTADYRPPYWVIDGTEVNRVLAYWRAGAYHVEPLGYDGYAPGAGNTNGDRHATDYQPAYWEVDGAEAQEALTYWRAGAYRASSASTNDGYLPDCEGTPLDASLAAKSAGSQARIIVQGPAGYDPEGLVTITNTFEFAGSLLSLGAQPVLPTGWELVSVSADGDPETQRGAILWTKTQPQSPIRLVYVVRVPLWETRRREIRTRVSYYFPGMVDPAIVTSPAGSLILSPRDTDGDGMPDGWESHYSGSGTGMSSDSDDDGDGMINRHECVAGTNPKDKASVLALTEATPQPGPRVRLRWQSAADRWYAVSRSADLSGTFHPVATNLVATPPMNVYEDATDGPDAIFYRIDVEP